MEADESALIRQQDTKDISNNYILETKYLYLKEF